MVGDTQTAKRAAYEMTEGSTEDLTRSFIFEGVYETVVEGGFHMQALSDEEADHLVELIARDGVRALAAYGESDELANRVTVTFHPEVWRNDYAYESDDYITYDILLEDATDENGDLFSDRSAESDDLKYHHRAPLGVQHYPGPYSITLDY